MKKTLLVTSLLAVMSTQAMAFTAYEQDSTKVDLYGRLGAYFGKSEKTNTDIFNDDSRLGLKVSHGITNDVEALGGLEFRFADQEKNFSDPTTHDAFIGLKHKGLGTVTLGRQSTLADDVALSKFAYLNENITLSPTHGDRTVKLRTSDFDLGAGGQLGLGVDYTFIGTNDKNVDVKSRSTGGALFYKNQFGDIGFKLNGGYSHTQLKDRTVANTKNMEKTWIVGTQLTYGPVDFGVDYSQGDYKQKNKTLNTQSPKQTIKMTQVALRYHPVEQASVFVAYQYGKDTYQDNKITKDQYTVGADYLLHKNVLAYAQVDTVKVKSGQDKDTDVGGAIGMRVLF